MTIPTNVYIRPTIEPSDLKMCTSDSYICAYIRPTIKCKSDLQSTIRPTNYIQPTNAYPACKSVNPTYNRWPSDLQLCVNPTYKLCIHPTYNRSIRPKNACTSDLQKCKSDLKLMTIRPTNVCIGLQMHIYPTYKSVNPTYKFVHPTYKWIYPTYKSVNPTNNQYDHPTYKCVVYGQIKQKFFELRCNLPYSLTDLQQLKSSWKTTCK